VSDTLESERWSSREIPENTDWATLRRICEIGNHDAGRAMGRMAEMALKMRKNQTALELLDQICGPYRGCDAEFESSDPNNPGHIHPDYIFYTDTNGPLGILIAEAFGDGRDWNAERIKVSASGDENKIEEFDSAWYDGPHAKFDARYEFY
jgi:hypothetical protein